MAQRSCRHCQTSYNVESRDTGFCSDRCFSRQSMDERKPPRLGWYLQLLALVGALAVWWWHFDVAAATARRVPALAVPMSRFLAWCGGDGIDRLLALAAEEDTELRRAALGSLEFVSDPVDARNRLILKLPEVRALMPKLDRTSRGLLIVGLGRSAVMDELETMTAGLGEQDLQLASARALGYTADGRAVQPILDLLGQWEWQLKHRPEVLIALLEALANMPDADQNLVSHFFPFLGHENPQVRAAAAAAIGDRCSDYGMVKASLDTAPRAEVYGIRQRLARLEKALTALSVAGEAEKEPVPRTKMGEAVGRMKGAVPAWGQ